MKDLKSSTKKKASRRDKVQYPAVKPEYNLKSRQDDIEDVQSYFGELPDSNIDVVLNDGTVAKMNPKEWMNKFMSEYNNAEGVADDDTDALHNTEELRKAARDRNNARNRCLYTQEKSQNKLKYVEKIEEFEKMDVDVFCKPVKRKRSKKD